MCDPGSARSPACWKSPGMSRRWDGKNKTGTTLGSGRSGGIGGLYEGPRLQYALWIIAPRHCP